MNCFDCPYGCDNDPKEEQIWCDKVGGKTSWYGFCSDAFPSYDFQKKASRKKRRNKWEREQKYKTHLKKLYKDVGGWYPAPVSYVDKIWIRRYGYVDNQKPYYKRLYRTKRSSYLKRLSSKAIRRDKGELKNGWQCHKLYDFWWELT